ncbi:hypothetical protein [Roseateles flavus]|uniref:Uncharacterized protein n=1 Tax=Roseateles flavus TaxID=3149041 RepID=A0ABV0GG46_9BURK
MHEHINPSAQAGDLPAEPGEVHAHGVGPADVDEALATQLDGGEGNLGGVGHDESFAVNRDSMIAQDSSSKDTARPRSLDAMEEDCGEGMATHSTSLHVGQMQPPDDYRPKKEKGR